MHSWWSMKSNSTSKAPDPYGTAEVVSPRGLTYKVTCHQWLIIGACARRTLPTICIQRCSVSRVAVQSSTRNAGQLVPVIVERLRRGSAPEPGQPALHPRQRALAQDERKRAHQTCPLAVAM